MSSQQSFPPPEASQELLREERRAARRERRRAQRRARIFLWGSLGASFLLLSIIGYTYFQIQGYWPLTRLIPPSMA